MGTHVGFSKSPHLPGFYIEPRAAELLIEQGWHPPRTQDPKGSFLLPEGGLMELTRDQADVALRRLADHYYEATKPDGELTVDNTEPRFGDFARKLSWQLGVDLDRGFLLDVLHSVDKLAKAETPDERDYAESDLNFTVNLLLDRTDIRGRHVLRYSEPVTI